MALNYTNGLTTQAHQLMQNKRWNTISVSMHHYDKNKLLNLYHKSNITHTLDFNECKKEKINISCNLIKGFIDCSKEANKMMDYVLELGLPRIGFVSLMLVNDYCKNNYIAFEDIKFETIPNVYFTKSMNRGQNCKCTNYLYNKGFKILEIYTRNYMNYNYCESSLVYDGEFLRQGFYENNIIY